MRKLSIISSTLVIALAACGTPDGEEDTEASIDELPEEMPDDFDFSLSYGYSGANEINTYEDTYTKDLAVDGHATTDLALSSDEMEIIYEEMKAVDILNMPNLVSDDICGEPYEENHLTVTADGEEIERTWIFAMCGEPEEQLDEFIYSIHQEMIEPRSEYQELPEPTGGYD